ncbi:MAG: biopolymer transport protein ExbD [Oceanicoccus sp.]|jgi:biopolymer transport protein ExbD
MKRLRKSRTVRKEAELDITAFMNLMIVLVPVLLLGMVFSQITVLDLKLPEAALAGGADDAKNQHIELLIRNQGMSVNYPRGIVLKSIPKRIIEEPVDEQFVADNTAVAVDAAPQHDFKLLSLVLQEVKRQLREQGIDKRNITILSEQDTTYQTIVSAMDTVRSYKTVVVVSVVDAELFPDISFGDAPIVAGSAQ